MAGVASSEPLVAVVMPGVWRDAAGASF